MYKSLAMLVIVGSPLLASAQSVAPPTMPSPAPTAAAASETSPPIINLTTPMPGQVTVMVPKDAVLVVQTAESLNSYSARTNERIKYTLSRDFVIAGYLIGRAGDAVEGQVEEGQAGESGIYGIGYKAANLRVSVDRIYTYCGSTIQLSFDRSEYRRRQGFFGGHKDVEIVKGQKYLPVVDHPQPACATRTDEQPLPIPNDALAADKG